MGRKGPLVSWLVGWSVLAPGCSWSPFRMGGCVPSIFDAMRPSGKGTISTVPILLCFARCWRQEVFKETARPSNNDCRPTQPYLVTYCPSFEASKPGKTRFHASHLCEHLAHRRNLNHRRIPTGRKRYHRPHPQTGLGLSASSTRDPDGERGQRRRIMHGVTVVRRNVVEGRHGQVRLLRLVGRL